MRRCWNGRITTAWAMLAGIGLGQAVQAQVGLPLTPGGTPASPAAMMANPYLNPYLNPYMNPAATQRPINGRDAALYMYMANSANGGLGSGQLSGVRPAPGTPAAGARPALPAAKPRQGVMTAKERTKARSRPAEMPDSASVPGSGAARFFNPGPVNTNGAGRYYARPNSYFNSNGR